MRSAVASFSRQSAVVVATLVLSPAPALVATSRQYTWSLLMFAAPSAVIALWFFLTPEEELWPSRRAFALTLATLVPLGWLLNLLFAGAFFRYPNPAAVLGVYLPGLTLHGLDGPPIPLEEFAFYASGFLALLLVYLWGDRTFFARYQADHRQGLEAPILQWAPEAVAIAAGLLGAGWALKARLLPEGGFPAYLAFLLGLPFATTLTLWRRARPLINWQAFSFMAVWLLGVSVLWEASLALPGGWWNYQHPRMVGLFVRAWSDLPLEAVGVWVLTAYATVVVFEALRVHAHRRHARRAARP